MGVAAVRRVRPRAPASTKRFQRAAHRPSWDSAPRTLRTPGFEVPWKMPAAPEIPAAFAARFADDGELLGVKAGLLVLLLLIAAILEVVA
jgi:hypothetical protein